MSRKRLFELDRAKGLAIFLVVIGHVVARNPPLGNEWYEITKKIIYYFHMPFFMFLSGFIIEYSHKNLSGGREYLTYIKSKFLRLMPAFLIMAIFIYIGKTIASHFIHVDNFKYDNLLGLLDILLYPAQSTASSLWYIYVLFLYYLIFPLIQRVMRIQFLWLIVGVGLFLIRDELPSLFTINRLAEFMLFIMIGVWIARNYVAFVKIRNQFGWLWLAGFVISIIFSSYIVEPKLILGLLSIPALMFLIELPVIKSSKTLMLWGRYVFIIYLLNTIIVGLVKGIGLKFFPWDGLNFIPYFILLTISGLYLPILIKKYFISRFLMLDKYTN